MDAITDIGFDSILVRLKGPRPARVDNVDSSFDSILVRLKAKGMPTTPKDGRVFRFHTGSIKS